jgi:hypothetical protein
MRRKFWIPECGIHHVNMVDWSEVWCDLDGPVEYGDDDDAMSDVSDMSPWLDIADIAEFMDALDDAVGGVPRDMVGELLYRFRSFGLRWPWHRWFGGATLTSDDMEWMDAARYPLGDKLIGDQRIEVQEAYAGLLWLRRVRPPLHRSLRYATRPVYRRWLRDQVLWALSADVATEVVDRYLAGCCSKRGLPRCCQVRGGATSVNVPTPVVAVRGVDSGATRFQ